MLERFCIFIKYEVVCSTQNISMACKIDLKCHGLCLMKGCASCYLFRYIFSLRKVVLHVFCFATFFTKLKSVIQTMENLYYCIVDAFVIFHL